MLNRIYAAFVELEKQVKKGTIKGYGISSNSFALPKGHPEFLPHDGLLDLAKKAAEEAQTHHHSFTTLQMPGNLLEQEALRGCAQWAHKNSVRVLINRPLNAFDDEGMWRLASEDKPEEYDSLLAQMKLIAEQHHFLPFLEELDVMKAELPSIGHYEFLLNNQIAPLVHKLLLTTNQQHIVHDFIECYERMVKHHCAQNTRAHLAKKGIIIHGPLVDEALKFLLSEPAVTCVLLGMRKENYVESALRVLDMTPERDV